MYRLRIKEVAESKGYNMSTLNCIGDIPTSLENRSAKTDRDRWTSLARDATVQGSSSLGILN